MDQRKELNAGAVLRFPGMTCAVEKCVGRGSNALVYEGVYQDAMSVGRQHRVLIKELFPYDAQGHIWRDEDGNIRRDERGEEVWRIHRFSFERGNDVHLQLLAKQPDQIGGNLNTFALNQTFYTILDYTGGRGLDREVTGSAPRDLRVIINRMLMLVRALDVFHRQGFLHLDISLDNVLLIGQGEQERVMLIDYNSVHTREELLENPNIYLSAKEGFTAPEIRTGMIGAVGPQTDLFAVASVFYACLMGQPPTVMQLNRKTPPDALDSPLLQDVPQTVRAQVRRIMHRGLCILPDKRYASCAAMESDLRELLDRLDGVGITHAALWEAGRKAVRRMVQQNPSLAYIRQEAELYPLRVQPEGGESVAADAYLRGQTGEAGASALLLGEGGMGKSTALLRLVVSGEESYSPAETAVMYLPLFGWKKGDSHYILDHVLMELRFDARTRTMEDARRALMELLRRGIARRDGKRAVLLLLLDGLNEAAGDASGLLEEIGELAALPGLRMVIASRTAPEGLSMGRAAMIPLEERDVSEALTRHGLLMPESAEMRELLRTPMMLSLFIKTAEESEHQVLCQTEPELLDSYLHALCFKQERDASIAARYQAEAAIQLVLPAIARELTQKGQPLDDQALLGPVSRCYRVLSSKGLSGAFPEWIGHSREILGEQDAGAEAWYGLIVHDLLWRKLGLLVRDEAGRYHILHQILQDDLADRDADNRRRLRSKGVRIGAVAAMAAALVVSLALLAWNLWLAPVPYDETMSSLLVSNASTQYVNCGIQYESMLDMLNGKLSPEKCLDAVTFYAWPVNSTTALALDAMRGSGGEVIPWSKQPMDLDNCAVLLALPQERAVSYAGYIRAYQLVAAGETQTTMDELNSALIDLLEADADIAWLLDQMVCVPHVASMSEAQRMTYDTGMLSLPGVQAGRSMDLSKGLPLALEMAYRRRRDAVRDLSELAVMQNPAVTEGWE